MNLRPKLPDRPFKTFQDFINYKRGSRPERQLPCLACDGFGKVHDEKDYDAYEGWKLAPWYKCSACRGTGEGSISSYKDAWHRRLWEWKALYDKILARRKLWDSAWKKLTPAERDELGMVYDRKKRNRNRTDGKATARGL